MKIYNYNAFKLLVLLGCIFSSAALDLSTCQSKAAMCCWSKKEEANGQVGKVGDNTDVCSVKGSIQGYFGEEEGPIHCHGWSWSNQTHKNGKNVKFMNELLTYVNYTDHYKARKYYGGVGGEPDCNCLDDLDGVMKAGAVVSRADCTEVVDEDNNGKPIFKACTGVNNKQNDLRSFLELTNPESTILKNETNLIEKCTKIHPNPIDAEKFPFDICNSTVVTCCWTKSINDNGKIGKADANTDICSVNVMTAGYDGEQEAPTHCHSFSWTNSSYDPNRMHKADVLKFMYMDHFRRKGLFGNLNGLPACGCLGSTAFDVDLSKTGCMKVGANGVVSDCGKSIREYLKETDPSNPLLDNNVNTCKNAKVEVKNQGGGDANTKTNNQATGTQNTETTAKTESDAKQVNGGNPGGQGNEVKGTSIQGGEPNNPNKRKKCQRRRQHKHASNIAHVHK